jgi:hypothetical protein
MIHKDRFAIDGADAMSFADQFMRWQEWSVQCDGYNSISGKFAH